VCAWSHAARLEIRQTLHKFFFGRRPRRRFIYAALIFVLFLTNVFTSPDRHIMAASGSSISLTATGVAYTQDFNTLASTGTSSTLPTGWALSESGTNANTTYTAGTGSNNAGDTYSFGASGNSERAFGGLQSGSLVPTNGACFTNNTGGTITSLAIAYTGEQWRLGASGRGADRLDFQLSTTATSLTTGTWIDYDNLDFSSPVTSGTVGALNGNAAANRTSLSFVIAGLNIVNGQTFFIRWVDFNVTNADDGLAIDDFSLTPNGSGAGGGPSGVGSANPSTVNPGNTTLLTVQVMPATNPPSSGLAVTTDLTVIGGAANQVFFDDATHGDVTAGDNLFSFQATVAAATSTGNKSLPVTINDAQSRTGTTAILLTVQSASNCARCGVERWSVKTGTDPDAALIDALHPTPTTIAIMRSWPSQASPPANSRIAPYETTAWTVEATLTLYKKEDDSDYHLVLQDAAGNTLISEIPCPGCVGTGSPFVAKIDNARAAFDARLTATTSFQTANIPVRVTGIGMFDFPHGQTGAAPNQIELHPIIDIIFNPNCVYGASTLNPFFSETGGEAMLNVTASGACPWTATSNANWINITSAGNGLGNGSVFYVVRDNFTASARQGTMTIAGQTVTVTQGSRLGLDCQYSIAPLNQSLGSTGGSGTVMVAASELCAWQAAANVPWVTITSSPNGIGNGSVTFSVAANPGTPARKGTITIAGQVFSIKQQGN
jgi:Putative binding domain, N-terminal/Viral BACON domain